uniref:Uncharacterized protein n=1 Tax=Athene cunicularia TaxID=194338 RepID=A0A663MVN7_ATHCN
KLHHKFTSTYSQVCLPKITCLQHSLLAHSDWNIIMSVIFSYESHHRPVLLWVTGIKCDEFISTVFIQSIHLDGILQSISKEKHFHLHWKKKNLISLLPQSGRKDILLYQYSSC